MVDPPIDSVDDHADAIAERVGKPLVDQPADDRRLGLLAMRAEGFGAALLARLASARFMVLMMSPRSPSA